MVIWLAILLGVVQGATEFIPVSSSGHLALVNFLCGGDAAGFHAFIEFINLGTLLALLFFYRKRIWGILKDIFHGNWKLALNITITCIPAGIVGLLLSDFISNSSFFSSIITIAVAMVLVGLVMIFISKLPHLKPLKDENHLTPGRALAIGCAQILALIPGVSRSGSTIIAGRITGLSTRAAADYSMLASIPLMTAVVLKSAISGSSRAYIATNFWPLLWANLAAFVVGLLAVRFLINYAGKKGSLENFGRYRVVVGTLVLALGLTLL